MAALTTERRTPEAVGKTRSFPVAASAVAFAGGIGVLNSGGFLTKASTATGLTAVGRIEESFDNTGGANGDIRGRVKRGIFPYANSTAADEITLADVGSTCYLVDDQTVAKTDGTGTRSAAGTVYDVTSEGVFVEIG